MKKLVIAASALLLSLGVNAQVTPEPSAGGEATAGAGGLTAGVVVGGLIAVGVGAAIVSNSSGTSLPTTPGPVDTCDDGTAPVNGVCTGTTTTVTGTGTNTSTTTVTFTYSPTTGL